MIIDLPRLKTQLGITGTENDPALTTALETAQALIYAYIGYDLSDTATVREYVYTPDVGWGWSSHRNFVHLPVWPIIEMVDVMAPTALPAGNYRVVKDAGRVDFFNGMPYGGNDYIVFHYRAGYDPVPADLQMVALNMASGIYASGGIGATATGALKSLTMFDAMSMSFETGTDVETSGPAAFTTPWAFVLDKYKVNSQPVLK